MIEQSQVNTDAPIVLDGILLTQDNLNELRRMAMVGRLSTYIAHDVNNLLTTIKGYSDLIQFRYEDHAYINDKLNGNKELFDCVALLLRHLIDSYHKKDERLYQMNLNSVVEGTTPLLRRIAGSRIAIELYLAEKMPPVMGTKLKIQQSLINLVFNAKDAMSDGGVVTLKTDKVLISNVSTNGSTLPLIPGEYARLSVHDTGEGIPPLLSLLVRDMLFSTKANGKGLGLTIANEIVKELGGQMHMDSVCGTGTTFDIYFPACC